MKKTTILSISIAALLVGGVLLTSLFTGQVYASSTDSGTAALLSEGGTTGRGEELATALGITVDELTTAWKKAFTAAVDDALKAGYITVSQAETLKAGDSRFRSLYRYLDETARAEFERDTYLAEALGISVEDLQNAYEAAKQAKTDQMIADGKLTEEQAALQAALQALKDSDTFTENLKEAIAEALGAEVRAGTLTQEQADLLIAKLEDSSMRGWLGMKWLQGRSGAGRD